MSDKVKEVNSRTVKILLPNKHARIEKANTEADALVALLISANPLRGEYDLSDEDYEYITKQSHEVGLIVQDMIHKLNKKRREV